jgi:NAD(P)-dependent dehydrogenase (short-subunit alcohol dehydrogenase family)
MSAPVPISFNLTGRRALVTGSSRGIGAAIVSALGRGGSLFLKIRLTSSFLFQ